MILIPQATIDEYTHKGWWGTTTLWDLFLQNLREQPEAEAIVDATNRPDFAPGAQQRWTWCQLGVQTDRWAASLLRHGIQRDQVVVVQLPNCVEQFAVYLACARLGIVITPVPIQYREHELAHILHSTQAVAAITFSRIGKADTGHAAAQMYRELQHDYPHLKSVLALDTQDAPLSDAQDLTTLHIAERAAAITANDVFSICWTSGTEANPKGVPRSHNEWLIIAPSIIEAAELAPHSRMLNPFPMVNMAGISTAFATGLVLGATVVQHQPFTLPLFLQQLRDERIDYTVAPPAVLNMLLQNETLLADIDFKRLWRIGSGSAPLSDWMVRGFADKYGVQIVNYFGSNEGAALSGNRIDIPDPGLRAQFFPRAGVEGFKWAISTALKIKTRLVNLDTGEDITTPGVPGEIRFSGPTIFSGYYGTPELTARSFDAQGYYKTGDLFEIAGDKNQYYRYMGRSKDLVMRGGVNISAEEIENLLLACPGVREAAVVGVPDATLGEKVCACIVPTTPGAVSLAALKDFLKEQKKVAIYKLPEHLLLLDALPRNPVGKIVKRDLREQAKAMVSSTAAAATTGKAST